MKRLNIYNKLFLAFCVAMICFIVWKVPHEKDTKGTKKQNSESVEKNKM